MDKLRALEYFVVAAQERSLNAAARRLEVSTPAVAKLLNSLERQLGTRLLERSARGLALTADGERYLDHCRPLLEQLEAADRLVTDAPLKPSGSIVLGAPAQLAQHCILPALPDFHARFPDILIDIRAVSALPEIATSSIDLFVLHGWRERGDFVQRRLALTRLVACAAPGYWAARGLPMHPKDLAGHTCLSYRNPTGTLIDLWQFQRGTQSESVEVTGWLSSDHRDIVLDAALAGEGVARVVELSARPFLASGRLVPALLDWEMLDAPPVNLLYRPNHRRNPRMRLFIEFVTRLFEELEADRGPRPSDRSAALPYWHRRGYGRASSSRLSHRTVRA